MYKKDRTPRCAAPEQGKPKLGAKGGDKRDGRTGGSDQFKAKVGAPGGRGNAGPKVIVSSKDPERAWWLQSRRF
jgi:hypothetical protein